jgi:hypothetical protein
MADDVPAGNPTARLLDALTKGAAFCGDQLASGVRSAEIFGLGWPDDKAAILRLGASLIDAADWTRTQIPILLPHLPNPLRGFDGVRSTGLNFSSLEGIPMANFMADYNEVAEYCLHTCSDHVSSVRGERTLKQSDLDDVLAAIREAMSRVKTDGDLDAELGAWLVDRLIDIERALLHYRVTGLGPVELSVDATVVGVMRRPNFFVWLNKSDTGQGVIACLQLALNVIAAATIFVAPGNTTIAPSPAPPTFQLNEIFQLPGCAAHHRFG